MADNRCLLIGCGILKKEVKLLIEKNGWPLDTFFLDSALHIDFDKLSKSLASALARHSGRDIIVFYGSCHPLMEKMLAETKIIRTMGQNCVEMLLGQTRFTEELSNGAFFLLEEWARRWDDVITKTYGKNRKVLWDIFHEDRKYLLCLRTACSGDFKGDAAEVCSMVGLPLRWLDVSLDHLESVLQTAITQKMERVECPIS